MNTQLANHAQDLHKAIGLHLSKVCNGMFHDMRTITINKIILSYEYYFCLDGKIIGHATINPAGEVYIKRWKAHEDLRLKFTNNLSTSMIAANIVSEILKYAIMDNVQSISNTLCDTMFDYVK